jgi:CDP-diglyceride synthetase
MDLGMIAVFAGLAVAAGMLVLIEAGRRMGERQLAYDPEGARTGLGSVDGAVFALLGLLVGFTFAGASGRFDERRYMVVNEANAIGTAWLRIDMLPAHAQPAVRDLFRRYLDSRLETYRALPDLEKARAGLARSAQLQGEIWKAAVPLASETGTASASMLLLPALNEMFDITTTRTMTTQIHPPAIVFVMLVGLALASALLAGYGMAGSRRRSWTHVLAFAAVIATTVYVIIDIEYPRLGLIRVDAIDEVLRELRASMG